MVGSEVSHPRAHLVSAALRIRPTEAEALEKIEDAIREYLAVQSE